MVIKKIIKNNCKNNLKTGFEFHKLCNYYFFTCTLVLKNLNQIEKGKIIEK